MSAINFKLQVSPGSTYVSLEGECDDVWNAFEKLCQDNLLKPPEKAGKAQGGKLPSSAAKTISGSLVENIPAEKPALRSLSLEEVFSKAPYFTDAQWLLIYLLFATKDGQRTISQRELSAFCRLYGRWTQKQQNGLSSRIRIFHKHGYVDKENVNRITLLPKGSRYAHALLRRYFEPFAIKQTI